VRPIAPARGFEKAHPWLWRFWMASPARGEISIFDESWYLRVLGDRANGDADKSEWRAAYHEIESFERNLIDDGTILIKLFFTIDAQTAKRRFRRAQKAGAAHLKRRKRNLARFARWQRAADEMLERTSTDRAPWHVIAAKSERFARGRTFELVIEALKRGLDERHVPQVAAPPAVTAPPAAVPQKTDGTTSAAPVRS
jgi:polyphosphate kinase 2 (PPK2 family)